MRHPTWNGGGILQDPFHEEGIRYSSSVRNFRDPDTFCESSIAAGRSGSVLVSLKVLGPLVVGVPASSSFDLDSRTG